MTTQQTNKSDVYMTLPGFSMSSLLMHIPQLAYENPSSTTIIIDQYDWERLRGRIAAQKSGHQAQRLALMYHQLHQQGLIKPFDYQSYYSQEIQAENIEETRALLSLTPDHDNRNVARQAANDYISYGLGEYQESLRESLNNLDRYRDSRYKTQRQRDKIERGTRDPALWNERVINQYLAALETRRNLQQQFGCNIQCIGQQESTAIASLFADRNQNEQPHTLQRTTGQLKDVVHEVDLDDTLKKREVADQISSIAQDVVGIDNEHWITFGPRLALLESGDTYTKARSHIRFNSLDSIVSEAKDLHSRLKEHREDHQQVEFLNEEAEWLIEQNDLNPDRKQQVLDQLKTETALTNYSRDLEDLATDYSPAAKTVVESIAMDPLHRYTRDDVYRKAVDLLRMLEPTTLTDEQLDSFYHRGAYRVGIDDRDWYQVKNRQGAT